MLEFPRVGLEYSPPPPLPFTGQLIAPNTKHKMEKKKKIVQFFHTKEKHLFVFWLICGPARPSSWALGMRRHVFMCLLARAYVCGG